MDVDLEGFYIIPEPITDEKVKTIEEKLEEIGSTQTGSIMERYKTLSNNLDSQSDCCIHSQAWIYVIIRWIAISLTIYLIILFVFFGFYKYKKDKHPFKHALRKSRPRGIIALILPVILPVIFPIIIEFLSSLPTFSKSFWTFL